MAKIYLDAGHGGSDPGAVAFGRRESDDVLRLANKIKTLLQEQGISVSMTRTTDIKKTINERTAAANSWGANYFISIHRNSYTSESAKGAEVWVYSKATQLAHAERIQKALVACGFSNRGVKKGAPSYTDFGVNSGTKMTSILAEVGFISNKADNALFDSKFKDIAKGLTKAICENVGVTYKAPATVPKKTTEQLAQEVISGKWGNGEDRKKALTAAGYDYNTVQRRVDELVKAEAAKKAAEAAKAKAEAEKKAAAEKAAAEATKKAEEERKAETVMPDKPKDPDLEEPVAETPKEVLEGLFVKLFALISKLLGK